jgi:hypothetical protein
MFGGRFAAVSLLLLLVPVAVLLVSGQDDVDGEQPPLPQSIDVVDEEATVGEEQPEEVDEEATVGEEQPEEVVDDGAAEEEPPAAPQALVKPPPPSHVPCDHRCPRPNEVWKNCSKLCTPTCETPNPPCPRVRDFFCCTD